MSPTKVVALAGGTGSAKLLRGLASEVGRFTVIANVGDNVWMHGLYVCPDLDIATYTLSGIADGKKGWGIAGDTFNFLDQIGRLGAETWFRLGDRDVALHVLRTALMKEGVTLTEVTRRVAGALGVAQDILPPTDQHVETRILTDAGEMHLQEFWVKNGGNVRVKGVKYSGADRSIATGEAVRALREAEAVLFCPANPVTSILPILAIPGIKEAIRESTAYKAALSPMIGGGAYSGPAPELMRALNLGTDSVAVAKIYAGLVDKIIIDAGDQSMMGEIRALGVDCGTTSTMMSSAEDEKRLARFLIGG